MELHTVDSGYRQFYVMDTGVFPPAPENWTQDHIDAHHNTLKQVTALVPDGNISARIFVCGPDDIYPSIPDTPEFVVITRIEITSDRIGVVGWPDEVISEFTVHPGTYTITFRGYCLDRVIEEKDYYGVEIRS